MANANENEELTTGATTTPPTTHLAVANTSTTSTPAQVGDGDDDDDAAGAGAGASIAGTAARTMYATNKQPVAVAGGKQLVLLLPRPQIPMPTKHVPPVAATPTTVTTTTTTRLMSAISNSGSSSSTVITTQQHLNRPSAVSASTAMPLFEVKLELLPTETETQTTVSSDMYIWHTNTEIRFVPSFKVSVENNFQQIVEQLLEDIHQTSHGCMPRRIADDKTLYDDTEDNDDSAEDEGENNGNSNNDRLNVDSVEEDTVECNNNDYVMQAENLPSFARFQHRRLTEADRKQRQTRNASLSTFHEVAVARRLQLQELTTKAGRSPRGSEDNRGERTKNFIFHTETYIRLNCASQLLWLKLLWVIQVLISHFDISIYSGKRKFQK